MNWEAVVERSVAVAERLGGEWLKRVPFGVAVGFVALATCLVIVFTVSLFSVITFKTVLYLLLLGMMLVALWLFFLAANVQHSSGLELRQAGIGIIGRLRELETHVLELRALTHQLDSLMIDRFHRLTENGAKLLHLSKRVLHAFEERLELAQRAIQSNGADSTLKINDVMSKDIVFSNSALHSVMDDVHIPNLPSSQWETKVSQLKSALEAEIRHAIRQSKRA